jgi:hypothetical protein
MLIIVTAGAFGDFQAFVSFNLLEYFQVEAPIAIKGMQASVNSLSWKLVLHGPGHANRITK